MLDAEDNGEVTDGSSLLGPMTGNGRIDENDDSFDDLRIWTKDAAGTDVLNTLLDMNVGANCLGNVGTSFDLLGSRNQENGEMARLGAWLEEDGSGAGVVSQVDLTV